MSHGEDGSLKTRLRHDSEGGKLVTSRHGSDKSDTSDSDSADNIVCCCCGVMLGRCRGVAGWVGDFGSVSQ